MALPECIRPENQQTDAVPIYCLDPAGLAAFLKKLKPGHQKTVAAMGFKAQAGAFLHLAEDDGAERVLFGLGEKNSIERTPFLPGKLASLLADGTYRFATKTDDDRLAALSFLLERYRFDRYRVSSKILNSTLLHGSKVEAGRLSQWAEAIYLARDLINTPANDLSPEDLEATIKTVGKKFGATVKTISGDALERGFPLIHAVGKGSSRPPRLVDLTWGKPTHPKLTLIGKGVVFDTGGLDIKPSSNMLMMKKDMGGAACTLALAHMVMAAKLPVRLRLLVPAVENSISGNSFRPSDVLASRKGITVEVGNTDAEGRLILADALTYAQEDAPDMLIDMATLTGAGRVALGPELPAYFTDDEALARDIDTLGAREFDPLWRLPLYRRYAPMLKSKIAGISSTGNTSFAGCITAALFLAEFVAMKSWLHIDLFAWSSPAAPGRPEGGEAQCIRTLFAIFEKRYGRKKP